jgi:hypothetical protein
MTPFQLETRTLQIVDRVLDNQPIEDNIVELKREWTDPYDCARRLAGHANAARGENIIWIIGIHDKSRTITGADAQEMSQWYAQVKSHHDASLAPDMIMHINVPYGDKTLVAMLFDTQRAPYHVKNPDFGKKGVQISLEVPWREGTSVRSARREDLLRLLTPFEQLPTCDVLDVTVNDASDGNAVWPRLSVGIYLVPSSDRRLAIPAHQCEGSIRFPDLGRVVPMRLEKLHGQQLSGIMYSRATIVETPEGLDITGPGRMTISLLATERFDNIQTDRAEILVKMRPAGATTSITISEVVTRRLEGKYVFWRR